MLSIKDANGNDITYYDSFAIINPIRYRGYFYDTESGLYYLQSRYYDPTTGRFVNGDSFEYIGANNEILGLNLFLYCENNHINKSDREGKFSIPAWTISVAIDAAIMAVSAHFHATWMGIMAPIKFKARYSAARFLSSFLAPKIVGLTGLISQIGVKILCYIGRAAYAGLFNLSVKSAVSALLNQPYRFISACLSVGGLISAVWDYFSDKKFDGWIKLW